VTWEQKIRLLKFEAALYELYASKIETVKAVLKSFDYRQVNVRITNRLQEEIPQADCAVWVEKDGNRLKICFVSENRCVNIGTAESSVWAYAANDREHILCVDAVQMGRFNYQAAEPQIDREAALWRSAANKYRTTDYSKLLADYKEIADSIKAFQGRVHYRIKDLLDLEFMIKNISCR